MEIHIFLLTLVTAALLCVIPAAALTTVQAVPSSVTLGVGETATVDIVIDTLPEGISGAKMDVSLSNGAVADITDITYAGWALLGVKEGLPADNVLLKAADLQREVGPGATDVIFATLTITGVSSGTTSVEINVLKLDDDGGYPVNVEPTQEPISVPTTAVPVSTTSGSSGGNSGGGSSSGGSPGHSTVTLTEPSQTQVQIGDPTPQSTRSAATTGTETGNSPSVPDTSHPTTPPAAAPLGILVPVLAALVVAAVVVWKR